MSYTTLTHLKSYLSLVTADDDDLLADLSMAVDAAIDAYTGTTFEVSDEETKTFTWGEDLGGWGDYESRGRVLYLDEWLADGPSLVVNGDGVTVPSSSYTLRPGRRGPHHSIVLNRYADVVWTFIDHPEDAVSVTGFWGYSKTPPADVAHAATRWTAYLYRQKDSQVFDQTAFTELGPMRIRLGMPTDVKELLDPYVWRTS